MNERKRENRSAMLYSFVVPIYNDGALADSFCAEFDRVFRAYLGTEDISDAAEIVFVNDGSPNDSMNHLRDVCNKWPFARTINLSRNFGHHIALSCGYRHAHGKFVGSLNVDMQDPPAELPALLERFRDDDVDIVIGLRRKRRDALMKRLTSVAYHYVLGKLTGYPIPLNMATVRVMNRTFVDQYNRLTEKSRFLPGLEAWLGFRRGYVEIEHKEREAGNPSYTFGKRLLMALDSIVSFSDVPLRLVVLAGSAIALVGFLLTAALVIQKLFFVDFQTGYTSTIAIIVFFGGVQVLVVGLASLYVGRILTEVQNRPLYVVEELINFDDIRSSDSEGTKEGAGVVDLAKSQGSES